MVGNTNGISRIKREAKSVTTDSGGNFYLAETSKNILNVLVTGVKAERFVRIHTYNTGIFGRLFDGAGKALANVTVNIAVISAN